ncbi:MAG: hypothetical protein ABI430_00120 [Candidatus Taylorbacteria bacterium]
MRKNILKSIGAGLAGIVVGASLSFGTDFILENFGILPHGNLYVSTGLIWVVLIYRSAYNVLGFYLVARLAPNYPMRHALVLGVIGTLVSVVGAVATANMNLGPTWYAWTLAFLTMPAAWLGGKLNERSMKQ